MFVPSSIAGFSIRRVLIASLTSEEEKSQPFIVKPCFAGRSSSMGMTFIVSFPTRGYFPSIFCTLRTVPMGFQEIGIDVSRFPAGLYLWEYSSESGAREAGRFEVVR